MEINEITSFIINRSIQIHKDIGPGLFESVYEEVLSYELNQNEIKFQRQVPIPAVWKEKQLDLGFRADLIIENNVIIEIKSVEKVAPVHQKQLLTYLKLSDITVGLLLNFNTDLMKNGITRIVNNY